MRPFRLLVAGLALLAASVASVSGGGTQAQTRWVITDLGTLGGPPAGARAFLDDPYSSAEAVNGSGQIVGWAAINAKDRLGTINHAFLWEKGRMRDLGTLGGPRSHALAINERGQVVGWADTHRRDESGNDIAHAFLWEHGTMKDLGTPGGYHSVANAINERGQVVGRVSETTPDGTLVFHAVLWDPHLRDLGTLGGFLREALDINERSQVVGWSETKAKNADGDWIHRAFLWQNGKMRDLGTLGGQESRAEAINDRGQIVGVADTKRVRWIGEHPDTYRTPVTRGFIWVGGRMQVALGTLGGEDSWATAVDDKGRIVGSADTKKGEGGDTHAVLWTNGRAIDLGALAGSSHAHDINNRGQIVGASETRRIGEGHTRIAHAVLWTLKH